MNMVSASAMRLCSTCLFWLAFALPLAAQAEQDWIDDELLELRITRACAELRAKDLLVPCEQLVMAASSAKTFPVTPAAPRTDPLAPEKCQSSHSVHR